MPIGVPLTPPSERLNTLRRHCIALERLLPGLLQTLTDEERARPEFEMSVHTLIHLSRRLEPFPPRKARV